jgi:sarcosine oxidase subunit gamma
VAESFLRHSPLAHLGLAARAAEPASKEPPGVTMGERPFRGLVNLRGPAGEQAFAAAVEGALGVGLPVEANTVASAGDLSVLWLGPDEWWVVTPDDGPAMAGKLRAALTEQRCAVTDVSESRTCIHVRGPRARDLLAKGCPLDLHPRVFSAGHCAQSLCAKATVTLHQVADGDNGGEDEPAYDLYVLNSFAEYLWLWLEDAAQEYGLRVTAE